MHTSGQCRNKVDNVRDIVRDHRRDVQRKLDDICDLAQDILNIVDIYYGTGPPGPTLPTPP